MKNNFDINVLSGNLLPVMETFQTIQGEGYFKGSSAYFIRIGGCDVGWHWCDIKESWDYNNYNFQNVNDIVNTTLNPRIKRKIVTSKRKRKTIIRSKDSVVNLPDKPVSISSFKYGSC